MLLVSKHCSCEMANWLIYPSAGPPSSCNGQVVDKSIRGSSAGPPRVLQEPFSALKTSETNMQNGKSVLQCLMCRTHKIIRLARASYNFWCPGHATSSHVLMSRTNKNHNNNDGKITKSKIMIYSHLIYITTMK